MPVRVALWGGTELSGEQNSSWGQATAADSVWLALLAPQCQLCCTGFCWLENGHEKTPLSCHSGLIKGECQGWSLSGTYFNTGFTCLGKVKNKVSRERLKPQICHCWPTRWFWNWSWFSVTFWLSVNKNLPPLWAKKISQQHTMIEVGRDLWKGLPCPNPKLKWIHWNIFPGPFFWTMSRWLLNTFRIGDLTISLSNLYQCLVVLTVK